MFMGMNQTIQSTRHNTTQDDTTQGKMTQHKTTQHKTTQIFLIIFQFMSISYQNTLHMAYIYV